MQSTLPILVAALATAALWYGYDNLSVFRRTIFWEFRYILFGLLAFLSLSALEWAAAWLIKKTTKSE